MGRHSAERDTAAEALESVAERPKATGGTPVWSGAILDEGCNLTLPEPAFDPDDCAAWNFEPFLRAIVNVELPEDPQ